MPIIVQKYGGSSVANAELIKNVALRIGSTHDSGNQVVAVVSAMGAATDRLIELAHQITPSPTPREMDLLLSTGEIVSCTLVAIALQALGYQSVSLSGGQAGIHTDTAYTRARITGLEPKRIHRELEQGSIVIVAGFQGVTKEMDITPEEYLDNIAKENTPIGRFGSPEELAAFFVFMCSPKASYCVGSTYSVDGGWPKVVK